MDINSLPQDDPDNIEESAIPKPEDEALPFTNQLKTGGAREILDEKVIADIWQSWRGNETNPAEKTNPLDEATQDESNPSEKIGGFFRKVTGKLISPRLTSRLNSKPEADLQSSAPNKNIAQNSAREKPAATVSNSYPFDSNDPRTPGETSSLSRNDLRNLNTRKLQDSKPTSGLDPNSTISRVDNEIARRIKAIRSESGDRLLESTNTTPPFVMEDDSVFDEKLVTLADKVKHGTVPPETIKLLISSTMSEEDVISVCKDLGIDWLQIPVNTREKKIQFLIEYFENRKNEELLALEQGAVPLTSKPVFLNSEIEQDWLESESRLQALQETLSFPEPEIQKPKASFFEHLKDEFDQSSRLVKILMISLSMFAVIIIVTIGFFLFISPRGTPSIPASPTYVQYPTPRSVEFPGGWAFNLQTGSVKDGIWNPTSPEWLVTTEICKLVSLPWNKQIQAIYLTFEPGDEILMTMSNGDLVRYMVDNIKTIQLSEMDQLINCSSPSLIIILTQKESSERQVLIATLRNSLLNSQITATTTPTQSGIQDKSTNSPQVMTTPTP